MAGLPEQWERTRVLYADDFPQQKVNGLAAPTKSAIMNADNVRGGGAVQTIGKVDISKYEKAASGKIRGNTLVLTENQKEHIIKRRGQSFYDTYSPYFADIAEDPDYIFADGTHENTAIASKTLTEAGKNIHLVIRLALVSDEPGLENSIITAIVEGDRRYKQRLRNKIPLYKK